MFSQLEGSEEGEVLLKSILNWMVANTKEKGRFHIVLTSSDPFFFNWIVDNLSKKEAEEYCEKHVLPRYGCKELEGKFDRFRRITGTRYAFLFNFKKSQPNPLLWKDSDLIKTMEAIVKAEDQGYILEDNLIEEIGFDQVNNSLVDYNFFTVDQPHDLLMILTHQMKQF
ncbi:hypothetical protein RhiirA5_419303 [Rhizophagus irregularis]|uniref:Uncharacterized protein n=1 Tax=Rhizophagus irregularis TaxID=588596 RepID=A0A2N0PII6_9GLOM|nr:hypothetical protein RhiirA5_419303 [Rhizophagus irregularis]